MIWHTPRSLVPKLMTTLLRLFPGARTCERIPGCAPLLYLALALLPAGAVPPLEFRVPPAFPIGDYAQQLVCTDLNGDGLTDVVSANADENTAGVLLGRSGGAFDALRTFPVGVRPVSIAVADFNGDAHPDVITANANGWSAAGTLSLLLGNGDGTFQPATTTTVDRGPRSVAAADFNGDGRMDVAVAISGGWFPTNRVSVLLGRGDGTFDSPVSYSVGREPWSVAAGDLNGDHRPDLVVANNGGGTPANTVSVLLNLGNGSFSAATPYTVGTGPAWVALADFDRDGALDAAVANSYGMAPAFSLLLGRGDGTFNPARNFAVPAGVFQLAVSDFNEDARLDVAGVGGTSDSGTVTVFLGDGAGNFGAPATYSVGASLLAIAAGDVTQDAHADLLVSGGYENNFLLLTGQGDGSFKGGMDTYRVHGAIDGIITADCNQDGQLDIVTVSSASNCVSVILQQTNGAFVPAVRYAVGSQPRAVSAADFNKDGRLDLVTANFDGTLTLLRGRTTAPGVFTNNWAPVTLGSNHTDVAVGDFNGDGNPDLVTPNYYGASLSVALGNGNGTFQTGAYLVVNPGPTCVLVNDFDQDGKADIAVGYESGFVITLLLGAGNGTFPVRTNVATWEIPARLAAGDFNFDGLPDLAAVHYDWLDVSVMINCGAGQFDPPVRHTVANGPVTLAVGDFNGDNRPDVVSANYACVSVLLGLGDGTFLTATNYYVGGRYAAVGDLNLDGMPDIVLDFGSQVGVFWNDTVPRLEASAAESGVRLAWPAWKDYQLETRTETNGWQSATITTTTYGSQYITTNPPASSVQWFRLKKE